MSKIGKKNILIPKESSVKVENNKVRIRPIAGTKPRGKTKSDENS